MYETEFERWIMAMFETARKNSVQAITFNLLDNLAIRVISTGISLVGSRGFICDLELNEAIRLIQDIHYDPKTDLV